MSSETHENDPEDWGSRDDDLPFAAESVITLSDRDRDQFLDSLANPPAPTPALIAAAARHKARRDSLANPVDRPMPLTAPKKSPPSAPN